MVYYRKEVMTESLGISIQSMCYQCQALSELCPDCQEQRDARDAEIAHQIVDESLDYLVKTLPGTVLKSVPQYQVANGGSSTEYNALSILRDQPSNHDWTDREGEFLEPIAMLVDRLYDLETSVTITPAEVLCQDCHLVYNKWSNCPNCY